jgi:hypothetical protein
MLRASLVCDDHKSVEGLCNDSCVLKVLITKLLSLVDRFFIPLHLNIDNSVSEFKSLVFDLGMHIA